MKPNERFTNEIEIIEKAIRENDVRTIIRICTTSWFAYSRDAIHHALRTLRPKPDPNNSVAELILFEIYLTTLRHSSNRISCRHITQLSDKYGYGEIFVCQRTPCTICKGTGTMHNATSNYTYRCYLCGGTGHHDNVTLNIKQP